MPKKIPDLRFIDGMRVVTVVKEYQATKDKSILKKIINHFGPFRDQWAKQLAKSGDLSPLKALKIHDDIVTRCANKFQSEWLDPVDPLSEEWVDYTKKTHAFNAYVVSALLNQVKGYVCQKRSRNMIPKADKR